MARKGRKYDSRDRHSSSKAKEKSEGVSGLSSNQVEFEVEEGKFDASNPLVLPAVKTKTKAKKPVVRRKVLSNKQKKKLELILRRKQKKEDRSVILNELAKHRIDNSELEAIKSASLSSKRKTSESESAAAPVSETRSNFKFPKPDADCADYITADPSVVRYKADSCSSGSSSSDEADEVRGTDPCDFSAEQSQDPVTTKSNVKKDRLLMTDDAQVADVRESDTRERAAGEQTVYIRVNRTQQVEESRQKLPIMAEEQAIMEAIRYNDVVIICGETGSGKTTQIPQFLFEAGYAQHKKIGVTEPRRVAATSMARRVAEEMSMSHDIVSFHVRYDRNNSDSTKVKFMTDGILLKEIQDDFMLTQYSVVIVDEAHERSVFSDILIGLLSRIVRLRSKKDDPLRLIIMSATLRVDSFADNVRLFPKRPPVLKISSRQFPVTVHFCKQTPDDFVQAAFARVCRIHRTKAAGGILVFVTGKNDVMTLCRKLRKTFPAKSADSISLTDHKRVKFCKKSKVQAKVIGDLLPKLNLEDFSKPETLFTEEHESESDGGASDEEESGDDETGRFGESAEPLHCLPLYSMLSKEKQAEVFKPPPPGHRLCVVATNVAETSLTIPDIKYVVDSGKVKTKMYDKTTGVSAFLVEWCSKASADQRAGRAGRTSSGHSFRLFSSAIFTNQFKAFSEPEIKLKPVDDLVLQMKSLGITNILNFPFPTPPSEESLVAAEKRLIQMGALEDIKTSVSVRGRKATMLTRLGQAMSNFPVSPRYARMFAFAYDQILPYITALVAGLTVQEIFLFNGDHKIVDEDVNNAGRRSKWMAIRRRWSGSGEEHLLGDLMVMLKAIGASEFAAGSASFSLNNGISHKAMSEVHRLRRQLTAEVNRLFALKSAATVSLILTPPDQTTALHLRQIALVGFFDHVARRIDDGSVPAKGRRKPYQSIQVDGPVFIDASSVLADDCPEFVVYQEIHETTKMFMRNVVAIESSWLAVYAPQMCTLSAPLLDPSPFYDRGGDCVMAFVSGTFGPHAWAIPVTAVPFPDSEDRFKWFAYFLLLGQVEIRFEDFSSRLLSHPRILFKPWIRLQPALLSIVQELRSKKVASLRDLRREWHHDPEYLMHQMEHWIPQNDHFLLAQKFRKQQK